MGRQSLWHRGKPEATCRVLLREQALLGTSSCCHTLGTAISSCRDRCGCRSHSRVSSSTFDACTGRVQTQLRRLEESGSHLLQTINRAEEDAVICAHVRIVHMSLRTPSRDCDGAKSAGIRCVLLLFVEVPCINTVIARVDTLLDHVVAISCLFFAHLAGLMDHNCLLGSL